MKSVTLEATRPHDEAPLRHDDLQWVSSFDVDIDALVDPSRLDELCQLAAVGSCSAKDADRYYTKDQIYLAREKFYTIFGLQESVEALKQQGQTLAPTNRFIEGQRVFARYGINGQRIVRATPATMGVTSEYLESRIKLFNDLGVDPAAVANNDVSPFFRSTDLIIEVHEWITKVGLDAGKIITSYPGVLSVSTARMNDLEELGIDVYKLVKKESRAIGLSDEALAAKLSFLKGITNDPVALINRSPALFSLSIKLIKEKMDFLTSAGIDAVALVNRWPDVLATSEDKLASNMKLYEELGLDGPALVKKSPQLLSISEENIRCKVLFINRTIDLFGWDGTAAELVNHYPSILGTNIKKLRILRRIAAQKADPDSSSISAKRLTSLLITPLETHLETADNLEPGSSSALADFAIQPSSPTYRSDKSDRQNTAEAIAASGSLGRIGTMYLDYRGLTNLDS